MHSFLTLLGLSLNISIPLFLCIIAFTLTHVIIIYIKRNIFIMENHINTCHIELYLINIWGTKGLQKHTKRLGHVILFKDTSINKILVIGILLIFVVGAFIPAVGVQVGSPARQSSEQTTPSVAVDAEESKGRATPTDSAILESKDLPSDSRPGPLDRDDPWWDTDWSYRKEITIDHTKVAASLVNFPVLISFASDADLASKAQDDGDDIVFINNALEQS